MSPIRLPQNRQSLTPRRSCIVLPLLAKRLILSFSLWNRLLREESRQEVVKVETQTAPDAEKDWSLRRHASRQSSEGVRHIPPELILRLDNLSDETFVQGKNLTMSCRARGRPSPTYEFFKNNSLEP